MQKKMSTLAIISSCFFLFSCTTAITGLGTKHNLRAEFITPEGNGPFPAVIILHSSSGVTNAEFDYARMLVQRGYACVVPHYYEAHNIDWNSRATATTTHAEEILADLADVVENLKKNPKIDKDKLGAVGFSMGGYWAVVLAARGYVQAGVSYYGVLWGVGDRNRKNMKYKFEAIFNEKSSPVLILHGESDKIALVIGAHTLSAMLEKRNLPYETQIYPDTGHGFDRGNYHFSTVANDGWNRTLNFFDKYVRKRTTGTITGERGRGGPR